MSPQLVAFHKLALQLLNLRLQLGDLLLQLLAILNRCICSDVGIGQVSSLLVRDCISNAPA